MGRLLRAVSRLSLSTRILSGLGLGIFLGLFLGEPAAELEPVADIYIRLMQMMVLPYLITALVTALGSLSSSQAGHLARLGVVMLLVVWALTAVIIGVTPLTFPAYQSASFFSHSLVEPRQAFSLAELYFTANPFESLSRAVVPAVVLFSSLIGISLIGLDGKDRLLGPLKVCNAAIVRVTKYVVELTPIGVFAIGAVTAGTMDPETFVRLEVYFVAFAALALLLGFWVLPLLVTAVTPFRYAEVTGVARGALMTAFVTHNAFIVLPILVEQSKELLGKHGLLDETTDTAAEVIVPVLFNFPNAGKLLTLLFVPFGAWMSGAPLPTGEYPLLFGAGIPSYFAKAQVALPYLLDLFGVPHDLFQLYIPTTIVTGKFDSLVTAMNLLVFALLGAGAMGGFLVFDGRRLARAGLLIAGGTVAVVVLVRAVLAGTVDTSYTMEEALRHMHRATPNPATIVHRELPRAVANPGGARLERIRARGTIRIGYDADNFPFSFFNADEELVGFDVVLAEQLAAALRLRAEFVPIAWPELPRLLADGRIDVMPGIWYRPYWFASLRLSAPYMMGTMGLAVRDDRRHEFTSIDRLRRSHGLKIGVPLDSTQIELSMRRYFEGSDVEFVVVEFWRGFFEGRHPEVDAFLMPAENAAAWTLLHPEYSVVVPQPDPVVVPYAFGMPLGADPLVHVVDEWVVFATKAGEVRRSYDYWVLGEGAKPHRPRWSIMRDVLGWGARE